MHLYYSYELTFIYNNTMHVLSLELDLLCAYARLQSGAYVDKMAKST